LRHLRKDDYAPGGRPLAFPELGRPLTHAEKYMIKKWRKFGVSEDTIIYKLTEG
jgi:hypothetical protein